MKQDPCPWPLVYDAGRCCGNQPCTIKWRRPCDAHGGCLDRSTCGGCDEPEYADKLHALAMKYQEVAATAGEKIFRLQTALTIIREWSMKNWDARAVRVIRDWIDSGMSEPLPWPGGAFFEEWAEKQGYSNVDGCVGLRITAQLVQDDRRIRN